MINILFSLLFFSLLTANQDQNMIRNSRINSYLFTSSDLNIRVSYTDNQFISYGAQWWISDKYFINGDISPNLKTNNSKIYHKISIGSLFFDTNNYISILELGIHRQRFDFIGESNWYELSISNKLHYHKFAFDFILTQLNNNITNKLLYSLSVTYILENMNQLNYIISLDEFLNFYPSINFNISI